MTSYQYVRNAYSVNPTIGARVRHNENDKWGWIEPEDETCSHYVMVRFDGLDHARPCYPTALDYPPGNDALKDTHGDGT